MIPPTPPAIRHPEGLAEIVERAAVSGVSMVIGAADVGKTTLVTQLAGALAARGLSVGVVDADLGQSAIGPPTTVGLGRVRVCLARLTDAELVAMHFVGVTSPATNLVGALVGVRRMVDRARATGLAPIVVDTSGLVAGEIGRTLKHAKIDLVDPDLVVCLERAAECEPILRPYLGLSRPAIVRLPVSSVVRPRSAEERRQFREGRLREFFVSAKPLALDLARVALRTPPLFLGPPLPPRMLARAAAAVGRPLAWAERRAAGVVIVARDPLTPAEGRQAARAVGAPLAGLYALADLEGALAGLEDAGRELLGLGIVKAIDFRNRRLVGESSVPAAQVAAVTIGRQKYPG